MMPTFGMMEPSTRRRCARRPLNRTIFLMLCSHSERDIVVGVSGTGMLRSRNDEKSGDLVCVFVVIGSFVAIISCCTS